MLLGALLVVAILLAIGVVMVSAIGVFRRPASDVYRRVWIKMGLHIGVLTALICLGATGTLGMAATVLFLAFRAWFELLRALEDKYGKIPSKPLILALGASATIGGLTGRLDVLFLSVGAATWTALALPMLLTRRPPPLHGAFGAAFGMAFISAPLGLLAALDRSAFGPYAFFLLLLMALDGFSEGFGRLAGKTPIWPHISPAKTLGGTIGGLVSCLVLGSLTRFLVPGWSLPQVLAASALVAMTAMIGDLLASSIKREVGIKDFGRILPTHGGVLDRIDSLLFSVPVFFAVTRWLGGHPG